MNKVCYTLITGAGAGFGKALAEEIAKRKMNLILVALPGEGLHHFAREIEIAYGVNVVAIEKDLCTTNASEELFTHINNAALEVNCLINNAGTGSTGLFEDGKAEDYEKQIRLNVLATTMLTYQFVPMLKNNSPSYILNVGSLVSSYPMPKKQVYGATKAFIHYFSRSLRMELKKHRVYVSVICPGGMTTNLSVTKTIMSGGMLSRLSSMKPETVVPAALNGLFQKKDVIIPGKLNKFFLFLNAVLPRFVKSIMIERTASQLSTENTTPPAGRVFKLPSYTNENVFATNKYIPHA